MGVSVYVRNLPATLDKYGLQGIFHKAGRVIASYIPKERRVGAGARYGFVRFAHPQEAIRSINLLNNRTVRGSKLSVSLARSNGPRRRLQTRISGSQMGRLGREGYPSQERIQITKGHPQKWRQHNQSLKSMKGKVNEDFIPWLSRSLVCSSREYRDLATLANAIINNYGQCSRISALSGFKFILTYQSVEARDAALENHEELDLWFYEVKKWDRYEACSSRKVWLEIIGVPPHGWEWENFKKIADTWGYFICLGKPLIRTDAFDSMKVLIETDRLSFIEDDFILHIEDLGYRVHVKEVVSAGVVHQNVTSPQAQEDENIESNSEVPGFEDVAKSAAQEIDGAQSEHDFYPTAIAGGNQAAITDKEEGEVNSNLNSNFTKENEGPEGEKHMASLNSNTRTKTAHFSLNEDSGEVMAAAKQMMPFKTVEKENDAQGMLAVNAEESTQEPPGFELRSRTQKTPTLMHETSNQAAVQTNDHGVDPILPPGFETREINARRPDQALKSGILNEDQGEKNSNEEPENQQGTNSVDSCEKLAREALHIGQLLGIKVVRNEKAAIEGIKESLGKKKEVKPKSNKKVSEPKGTIRPASSSRHLK